MTAPSKETQEKIQQQIRKLFSDSCFVAPEAQESWWGHKLAAFAGHIWEAAVVELSPKKLKTLEEHNAQHPIAFDISGGAGGTGSTFGGKPVPNGIACERCGSELFDSSPNDMLTSYPPQLSVHCAREGCGYKGYRRC